MSAFRSRALDTVVRALKGMEAPRIARIAVSFGSRYTVAATGASRSTPKPPTIAKPMLIQKAGSLPHSEPLPPLQKHVLYAEADEHAGDRRDRHCERDGAEILRQE